jgi:hypothetical protein
MSVITILPMRSFYVKLSNIQMNDPKMMEYKHISASSGSDLLDKVCSYYGFNSLIKKHIRLYYRIGYHSIRIDDIDHIPEEYEFIYVVGI